VRKKRVPSHNQYLISIQRPHLWLLSLAGVLAVIASLVWLAFYFGQYQAGHDRVEAGNREDELHQRIDELVEQNEDLQRQNAKLSRDMGINIDAGSQVEKDLASAQAQIMDMKEELTFYRSIVQSGKASRTVTVKKIQLLPDGARQYKYKMVLVQDGRNDMPVRGMVEFYLEGAKKGDQIMRLEWPGISVEKVEKQQKFGFKYFQNFEGSIRIPEGFVPASIFVRVLPSTPQVAAVEESYPWDAMLNEEST
jgi:hypothetical protein